MYNKPRKMFLDESKPAAYIEAWRPCRSVMIRQANLEMVDWLETLSTDRLPGTVSITTKSMGDSELRPIWNRSDLAS